MGLYRSWVLFSSRESFFFEKELHQLPGMALSTCVDAPARAPRLHTNDKRWQRCNHGLGAGARKIWELWLLTDGFFLLLWDMDILHESGLGQDLAGGRQIQLDNSLHFLAC